MPTDSMIRLLTLAPRGNQKIEWIRQHMSVLDCIRERFAETMPFENKNIVMRLHIEATTACLAILLRDAGAEVTLVQADPLSTQDDVAAALAEECIKVFGHYGSTLEEHQSYQKEALESKPHVVIDMGGILTHLLHGECHDLAGNFIGASEESTTGVKRLKNMLANGKLKYPVIAVNDSLSKYLFENVHGTGQSVWSSIMNTTNLVVGGKVVVVIGYGWTGKGIARKAKALGARVIISEVDPAKASEAILDGLSVMPLVEAVSKGDFIITATGNQGVVNSQHLNVIKNRAILVNAGHSNVEINKCDLEAVSVESKEAAKNIRQYTFEDGRKVFLLAEGRVVNSAAGDGQPAEVMDISFALHAMAVKHLIDNPDKKPDVSKLPRKLDEYVSSIYLHSMGIEKDELSEAQKNYLSRFPF
ncbi:MAG: adenosylhomocysteinase [Bacillota bacterium]